MDAFTLSSHKILKCSICSDSEYDIRYMTTTTKKGYARHHTALEDGTSGAAGATIDWRERTFEISGTRQDVAQMKTQKSMFSGTRYWRWLDGEEYKVKYWGGENTWQVLTPTEEVVAAFTSYIGRIFSEDSLPILRISHNIREEAQRRFLILILLYSETKRLDSD
ncbi:hypothetical protein B0H10DRAFT_2010756 [Mycena sp. CBHHK59/15]|nr:hypothetical protein B0H10DRAFT_2010756 [Mycena sp. CBHHK59/15]